MGMTAPQIAKLSLSTPQPMRTHQHVYEAIESAGFLKLYRTPLIERRRIGPHNVAMIDVFMRTYGQALEHNFEVSDVMRDEAPHPKSRNRVDVGMRINDRLFFWECQVSKLYHTRWYEKLRGYMRLYERREVMLAGDNFRCNLLLQDGPTLNRVRYFCQELLYKTHPSLNLFNFIEVIDHRRWNILTAPVWTPTWDDANGHTRKVSLM